MHTYTEEQHADFQERAKAFQEEFSVFYKELMDKHRVELVTRPIVVPTHDGLFSLAITQDVGDLKYKSVPSPLSGSVIQDS